MRLLAALLLVLLVQDPDPRLGKLLDRLRGDDLADRDAAQAELADYLDDDAKAEAAKRAAAKEPGEVAARIAKALESLPVNKALKLLATGDESGLPALLDGGDPAQERVEKLLKASAGQPEVERACRSVLARITWAWHPADGKVRVGFRTRNGTAAHGGSFALEVKVVNESAAHKVFGNSTWHMHVQFSPKARMTDSAGLDHDVELKLDTKPLPSECDGNCEVKLAAGKTAILKGTVETRRRGAKLFLDPGVYRLQVHLEMESLMEDEPASIPLEILGKK